MSKTRPDHYCFSEIEPKDAIRDWNLGFNLGNVVKYVVRAGRKDGNTALDDLRKARQYINFEIDYIINGINHGKDDEDDGK